MKWYSYSILRPVEYELPFGRSTSTEAPGELDCNWAELPMLHLLRQDFLSLLYSGRCCTKQGRNFDQQAFRTAQLKAVHENLLG